jgi:hypothetical protein
MSGARRPIIAEAQSGLLSITSSALTEPAAVPHWSPSWCRRRDKGEGFGGQIGHAPQQSHDTVWPTAITCFLMLDDKREISNTSMGDFDTATKLCPWPDIDEAVNPKDRVCRATSFADALSANCPASSRDATLECVVNALYRPMNCE